MNPGYRPFTTSTGFTIQYRTLPPDFLPALRARVRREHEATKPTPPTARLETAPGTFVEQPIDVAGDLPEDEGRRALVLSAREALRAWEKTVTDKIVEEMKAVMLRTVKFPLDAALITETRELDALADGRLAERGDDYVMLFGVILTDITDQQALAASLEGMPVEEAAAGIRAAFRRQMEGAALR